VTHEIRVRQVTAGDAAGLGGLASLFDAYRVHYGAAAAPQQSRDWLGEHLSAGRLLGFVADDAGTPAGVAVVAVSPASQRLAVAWNLRDLYVDPAHRRRGVAGALLDAVREAARSAGAIRVFLQTEDDNAAARALYAAHGFEPVAGYVSLSLEVS